MKKLIPVFVVLLISQSVISQSFTESNLPLIFIDTQGQEIPDEPKITAKMKVLNDADGINNVNDTDFEYDGYIGIEVRGNTSQIFFDKKSFSLETRTESGDNNNVSLLGLPEENDWVLHGPFSDKSLMRNVIAYYLGNATGNWSPRTMFCEVFINGEYRGVYVFMEKIKIDDNRVDIATLLPEDISGDELTGGYILRIDRHRPGCWISPFMGRTGSCEVPISYFDPPYDELTTEQKEYIKDYVTDFEYALAGEDFKDPVTGYRAYINIDSFLEYFFVSEISRDLDGYRCSVYFHKDKDSNDGKINMSPLWDYNLGFGNGDFFGADNPIGWVADGIGSGDWYEVNFWWDRLREDPYYNSRMKIHWNSLRSGPYSNERIFEVIDSCAALLDEAQERNFEKFDILDQYVWPNPYIGYTYQNEIIYLKSWFTQRMAWLDSQMEQIIPLSNEELLDEPFADGSRVEVYPNPFNDKVTLHFKLTGSAEVKVLIYNVLGEKIIERSLYGSPGTNNVVLDAGDFDQGDNIFFYNLIIDNGLYDSGKIVRH